MNSISRRFRATLFLVSVAGLFGLLVMRVGYLSVFAHERARAAINEQVISEEPIRISEAGFLIEPARSSSTRVPRSTSGSTGDGC